MKTRRERFPLFLTKTTTFIFSLVESRAGLTTSRLIVKAADQTDTGDYACSSDAGSSNSTAIHVITGKYQRSQNCTKWTCLKVRMWGEMIWGKCIRNIMQISRLIKLLRGGDVPLVGSSSYPFAASLIFPRRWICRLRGNRWIGSKMQSNGDVSTRHLPQREAKALP